MKEIVVGTYRHTSNGNSLAYLTQTSIGCGHTDIDWNKAIREAGFDGIELEIILRPKDQDTLYGFK